MDFLAAEKRLQSDHNQLRSRNRNRNASRTLASSAAASKAKKAEEFRRKQLEKKKQKQLIQEKKNIYIRNGFELIEKKLGVVRNLNSGLNGDSGSVLLEAVSVHGHGDKITLPSSVLSTLAERDLLQVNQERGQPLFFRIGIMREGYSFPQSDAMKKIMEEYATELDGDAETKDDLHCDENIEEEDEAMDDEDDEKQGKWMEAYLQELASQYISYTYATVIEFSQDEGFIGLPIGVANALIQSDEKTPVESRLTIDPSKSSQTPIENVDGAQSEMGMDVDDDDAAIKATEDSSELLEEKTPGHPAYELFPVPVPLLEISLLTHLPLGEKCTLQPTRNAIENGFYNLKNVKLALEQSLIRTRGSLNEKDVMYCWFRGKKFDLSVLKVFPPMVGAISCVNCDIEVDIAPPATAGSKTTCKSVSENTDKDSTKGSGVENILRRRISGGYKLSDTSEEKQPIAPEIGNRDITLPSEPSEGEENIMVAQIRGRGRVLRRRFRLDSTMKHIFDFAVLEGLAGDASFFKLVTRFPRRVFQVGSADEDEQLVDFGFPKQEAFIVEE